MRPNSHLATLDGWRAVAVGLVLTNHVGMILTQSDDVWWLSLGSLGVNVFFALSGLLITSLLLQERERRGEIDWRAFYRRRLVRIVPAYAMFLLAVTLIGGWRTPWELLSSVAFLRNFLPRAYGSPLTGHLWSLAVEMHFYFLWPWLLRRAGPKHAASAAAYGAMACILWRHVEMARQPLAQYLPDLVLVFRTDMRLDGLFWGCVIGVSLQNPASRERLRKQLSGTAMTILSVIAAICALQENTIARATLAFVLPLLLSATLLHPQWRLSRLLELGSVRWIGRLSYSFYLWQQILFLAVPLTPWRGTVPLGWLVLAVTAATLASYYGVEQPVLRWYRRREASNPSRPLASAERSLIDDHAAAGA